MSSFTNWFRRNINTRALLAFASWALLLTALSQIPSKSMPKWGWLSFDKVVHLGFYIPLGFFALAAMKETIPYRLGWVLMIVTLFGGCDEVHQHFVPGRYMDSRDVLADIAGGGIGGLLYLWWSHRRIVKRPV